MSTDEKIGRMIRAAGQGKSQLSGDYTPPVTDDQVKVAEIAPGEKTQGTSPMESFSADKVISAVNNAKTLDEKLKAYTSSSGYTTLDQDPSSTAGKS